MRQAARTSDIPTRFYPKRLVSPYLLHASRVLRIRTTACVDVIRLVIMQGQKKKKKAEQKKKDDSSNRTREGMITMKHSITIIKQGFLKCEV